MSHPFEPRRPGPPHNPEVRELVEEKRRWSSAPKMENAKQGFRGWHERGYLPHRDEPGLTQFVTYRLADSFPESLRSEWQHFLKLEDDREQRKQFEAYLDKGRGECHLRRPEIAQLVEDNFRQFSGCGSQSRAPARYELKAWLVGPGTLYGSLGRMIEAGLICESDKKIDPEMDDERRVYYQITALGEKSLEAELQRYREVVAIARRKKISPVT